MLMSLGVTRATDPNVTTIATNSTQTVASCSGSVTLSTATDYVITATSDALTGSINITNSQAVVIFQNIKPSTVSSSYLSKIKINGSTAQKGTNCRVEIYRHGAIVLPYANTGQPLTVYDALNTSGNSKSDFTVNTAYRSLGTWDNAIMSFTLKRGYMVTMANHTDGTGYSHCFIANDGDITVNLPATMRGSVSFLRVFPWRWPSKKGYAGYDATPMGLMNVTWMYRWDAGVNDYDNYEYVPMRHHETGNAKDGTYHWRWPEWGTIDALNGYSHVLGQNEPDNTGSSSEVYMTVDELIKHHKEFLYSGMRIGTFACCNPNTSWVKDYVDRCKAQNMRVDFVATHYYIGGQSPSSFISSLKALYDNTGLPVWVTEWNNGANWTSESGFTLGDGSWYSWGSGQDYQKNGQWLVDCLTLADNNKWLERLAIYNDVGQKRYVHWITDDHWTTVAGDMYGAYQSDFAYSSDNEYYMPWNYTAPSGLSGGITTDEKVFLTWTNTNTDCTKTVKVQRKNGTGWTDVVTLGVSDDEGRSIEFEDASYRGATYRICNVDADGTSRYSNTLTIPSNPEAGVITLTSLPSDVQNYYFRFYSTESSSELCWGLADGVRQGGYKAVQYGTPVKNGADNAMTQTWQFVPNGSGYALANLSYEAQLMHSPNSWNFRTNGNVSSTDGKAAYLPAYDATNGYWTVQNLGHSGCYCGLWDNNKNFVVGAELAGNRTLAETDHLNITAMKRMDFHQMRIDNQGLPTDLTYAIANHDFTWGTYNAGAMGSGANNVPNQWTFSKTFDGWNDTKLMDATIEGATVKAVNVWAGVFTYAEVSQKLTSIPNGVYHLSAYLATDSGTDPQTSRTAIYGAPTNGDYVGRSVNITGYGVDDYRKYDVYVQVDDNELTVGVRSDGKWFKAANFKLEYMGKVSDVSDEIKTQVELGRMYQRIFLGLPVVLSETSAVLVPAIDDVNIQFERKMNGRNAVESGNAWNTICFPFSMTTEQISSVFGAGTVVKELSEVRLSGDNASLKFRQVNAIEANKPYIMQVDEGHDSYLISGVDIAPADNPSVTVNGVEFRGNYIYPYVMTNAAGSDNGTDYYLLNDEFRSTSGRTKLKGYRAYFHVPASTSGVKALNLGPDDGEGTATGIVSTNGTAVFLPADIYTLSGQLVRRQAKSLEGLRRGIYLVGGQRVLVNY